MPWGRRNHYGRTLSRAKRVGQDRSRINLNEDFEVRDWSQRFGVTVDELRKAVAEVAILPIRSGVRRAASSYSPTGSGSSSSGIGGAMLQSKRSLNLSDFIEVLNKDLRDDVDYVDGMAFYTQ